MFGEDGNQPSYLGANFTPWPNVGQGSELPYARWVEPAAQQGTLGPSIPRPGQPSSAQPPSPNYGYAAPSIWPLTWTGPSKWTYQMDSSGTVRVLAEPKNKYVGMTLTPSSGKGYIAVLNEYLTLFSAGKPGFNAATFSAVKAFKTTAEGTVVTPASPVVADIAAQLTGGASRGGSALTELQAPTSSNTIYYVIGGVALVGGIGAAVYLLTRKG